MIRIGVLILANSAPNNTSNSYRPAQSQREWLVWLAQGSGARRPGHGDHGSRQGASSNQTQVPVGSR